MKSILGLALILILAACGGGDGEGGDSRDNRRPTATLQDTCWQLEHVRKTSVPADVTISATFVDGKISGRSGCNSYFSSYELGEGTITIGPVGGTKMMCPDDVMKWEAEFTAFLEAAATYRIDGDRLLIFRKDGEALTFEPAKPGS